MTKEVKIVVFVLITMILNVVAPIVCVKTYKDYTRKSEVYGEPQGYPVSTFVDMKDYVFQENLSEIAFTEEDGEDGKIFTYNYTFASQEFDSTQNNYSVFVNDYLCSITSLSARGITVNHSHTFYDINKHPINTVDMTIEFKFYSNYSTLLITATATDDDMSYFNSYRENPGFILTVSKVRYEVAGNSYQINSQIANQLTSLQRQLNDTITSKNELQTLYNTLLGQYSETSTELTTLRNQISILNETCISLNAEISRLNVLLETYQMAGKVEVTFMSHNECISAQVVDENSTLTDVPNLTHTETGHFVGWTINGTDIVDLTDYILNENVTFVAVWTSIIGEWVYPENITGYGEQYMLVYEDGSLIVNNDNSFMFYCSNREVTNIGYTATKLIFNANKEYHILVYDPTTDVIHYYWCEFSPGCEDDELFDYDLTSEDSYFEHIFDMVRA